MKSVDQDGKCRTESDCDWIVKKMCITCKWALTVLRWLTVKFIIQSIGKASFKNSNFLEYKSYFWFTILIFFFLMEADMKCCFSFYNSCSTVLNTHFWCMLPHMRTDTYPWTSDLFCLLLLIESNVKAKFCFRS